MKILFFSPNSFLDVHATPEALVSKALSNKNNDVIHINCDGMLSNYCVSMSAANVKHFDAPEIKQKICKLCKIKRNEINKEFKLKNINIDQYLLDLDLIKINEIVKDINPKNWYDFELESIPVGRFAAYELVLNEKINSIKFTDLQWEKYLIDFQNVLKVFFAFKKIINNIKPDRVVIYNNLYSVNSVVHEIASNLNIPSYSLHAGGHHVHMYSQMTIFRARGQRRLTPFSLEWKKYSELPISKCEIEKVFLHIRELLLATSPWVYSTKSENIKSTELFEKFKINKNQNVALVTMSSEDEKFAGSLVGVPHQRDEPIFKSYFEWITYLVDWAESRPELKLIIRVHPREFPNKRENVLSKQAEILKKYFTNLPQNVIVNWPEDNVSLYDLLKIVDLGLNSSSSAGLEMLLFGIPVIIIDENQLIPYPIDLNIYGKTKEDYLNKLNCSINLPRSIDNIISAFRWLSFIHNVEAIDISDGYRKVKSNIQSKFDRLFRKFKINEQISENFEYSVNNLVEEKWLTYAIESGNVSHLKEFTNNSVFVRNNSSEIELKLITRKMGEIFKELSKDDIYFKNKLKVMGFVK